MVEKPGARLYVLTNPHSLGDGAHFKPISPAEKILLFTIYRPWHWDTFLMHWDTF